MDLNEITKEVLNRHPWELSRTKCVLSVFAKYLDRLHERKECCIYVNAGAGDLYFDKALMKKYKKDEVYAVDIGYKNKKSNHKRINKYHYLEEIQEPSFDYAIMMDSLEYMEDDVEYIKKVVQRLKKGGFFFFTLPAIPGLFSDYDKIVKNLRRYDRKTFSAVLRKVPELKKVEEHYFYTSLFMIRFIQKNCHLQIDPKHKVTANWQYAENGIFTRLLTGCLNLDFAVNRILSRIGIYIPGLSLLVVCRKV